MMLSKWTLSAAPAYDQRHHGWKHNCAANRATHSHHGRCRESAAATARRRYVQGESQHLTVGEGPRPATSPWCLSSSRRRRPRVVVPVATWSSPSCPLSRASLTRRTTALRAGAFGRTRRRAAVAARRRAAVAARRRSRRDGSIEESDVRVVACVRVDRGRRRGGAPLIRDMAWKSSLDQVGRERRVPQLLGGLMSLAGDELDEPAEGRRP